MNDYKKLFPIFNTNPNLVYLDSSATALKPQPVLDKMNEYYTHYSANIHRGVYGISERATDEYEKAREKVAKFIGAETNEVVFTGGTTAGINLVARGWGDEHVISGDEIVVTEAEHHSNLVPWQQLAKRKNAILKYLKIGRDFRLDLSDLEKIITKKTKILAIQQVSNVLGLVNPIEEIVKRVRAINPGILVVVDGAQAVAHLKVDVKKLDVDFYAFSGHKMYGPTGVGSLYGKAARWAETEPENFGGGMIGEVTKEGATWAIGPAKFEAGTPMVAEAIGMGAAADFIENIGFQKIVGEEKELLNYALKSLKEISGLKIFSAGGVGVISMVMTGVHAHDVATILDREGVCVRAGHHCAMPLHQILGEEATFRMSLGIYNDKSDIDKLVTGINKVKEIFKI